MKIHKEKRTRFNTTRAPETVTAHFYKQQKNLKEHKDQEQAMYDVNVHHKTIIECARFILLTIVVKMMIWVKINVKKS